MKVEQSHFFVELLCFCLLKVWNIFFLFRRWNVNEFLFRWQLRYVHDKISLVFEVFLHFFTVFCVFSLPVLSFLESFNQIRTQRKQLRMFFFNFIVLLCPLSFCFQSVFSSFIFRLVYYIIIFVQILRTRSIIGSIILFRQKWCKFTLFFKKTHKSKKYS